MNEGLIAEFLSLGCKSQRQAAATLQVYIELCEVKKYWDVEYFYNKLLDTMYICGKKSKTADISYFVPLPSTEYVSFDSLSKYGSLLKSDTQNVYVAIVDADSTCVYYQVTNGLGKIEQSTTKQTTMNKREKLEQDLKKYKNVIEQSALFGMTVHIPRTSATNKLEGQKNN